MKHIISIAILAALCAGCTMGINQSVATIKDKTYLVEKKTYVLPIIPIYQWSSAPMFTDLEDMNISEKLGKEFLNKILSKCYASHKNGRSDEIYNCVLEKIYSQE